MNNWILWLIAGIISIGGGFLALANPLAATFTAVQLAGWFFLIVGCIQAYAAFSGDDTGSRLWAGLTAVFLIFLGVSLLARPFEGILTLTLLVAIMFLVTGIAKMFLSLSIRGTSFFWAVMLSGLISVVLALMIFSNFPQSAATILGILLAIDLISTGVSLVALALLRQQTA